jgi:hypothetical protein
VDSASESRQVEQKEEPEIVETKFKKPKIDTNKKLDDHQAYQYYYDLKDEINK